jgi:hypothetical protein
MIYCMRNYKFFSILVPGALKHSFNFLTVLKSSMKFINILVKNDSDRFKAFLTVRTIKNAKDAQRTLQA